MVYRFEYHFYDLWNMIFTSCSTRMPRLVEHDVVGGLGESSLRRVAEMLVVVEIR